jgi:hypothetical protein
MKDSGLQDLLLRHNKVAMLDRGFKSQIIRSIKQLTVTTQMNLIRLICIRSRAVHAYAKKHSIVGCGASIFLFIRLRTDGTITDWRLQRSLLSCSIKWTMVLQSLQFRIEYNYPSVSTFASSSCRQVVVDSGW